MSKVSNLLIQRLTFTVAYGSSATHMTFTVQQRTGSVLPLLEKKGDLIFILLSDSLTAVKLTCLR